MDEKARIGRVDFSLDYLDEILRVKQSGKTIGIPSVCSAHPLVLEAVFQHAGQSGNLVLIEATANQVNQFGGYTGMLPADFVRFVHGLAEKYAFPSSRLFLGGDHLGPLPWSSESAASAMDKAKSLVRAYAMAGFSKIHLDCSVSCVDDYKLSPDKMAQRAAELAAVVEEACETEGLPFPRYVIGTEVPAAGGAKAEEGDLLVTQPDDAARTIEITRQAFLSLGLHSAWERVKALVVQPGVEFGHDTIHEYDRPAAQNLTRYIETIPNLMYEAHSTDYQPRTSLQQLVEDHFAILKVGPGLTFAMREAIFGLAQMEDLLCEHPSRILEVIEKAMQANPVHWQKHFPDKKVNRQYSFSDRIRYYWPDPAVRKAFEIMMENLKKSPIPWALLSQYFPEEYTEVRDGNLANHPKVLILRRIIRVLENYDAACFPQSIGVGQVI